MYVWMYVRDSMGVLLGTHLIHHGDTGRLSGLHQSLVSDSLTSGNPLFTSVPSGSGSSSPWSLPPSHSRDQEKNISQTEEWRGPEVPGMTSIITMRVLISNSNLKLTPYLFSNFFISVLGVMVDCKLQGCRCLVNCSIALYWAEGLFEHPGIVNAVK